MTRRFPSRRLFRSFTGLICILLTGPISQLAAQEPATPTSEPAGPPGPRWSSNNTTFNFGQTWATLDVTHSFEFKNIGDQTLKILEAKPRCSCSVAGDYTREIPPGKTGVIPFLLKTAAKHGPVDETLTIKTNDPERPDMVLRMTGRVNIVCKVEVIHDDAIRDGSLELMKIRAVGGHFGHIAANQQLGRILRMTNLTGAGLSLRLIAVIPNDGRFTAELKDTKPSQEYQLSIKGHPPFPDGATEAEITFGTNIPELPLYRLPINAYVPPRIEVVPYRIVVDPTLPLVPTRVIRINNNGESSLEVTAIATTDPSLHISLLPNSAEIPKTRAVQVIIPQGYHPSDYGEIIRIDTTDKEKARIEVPLVGSYKKPPTSRPADQPIKFYPVEMPSAPARK